MSTLTSFKPGQKIRCTITKAPMSQGDKKTIERLMRKDPTVSRGLRKSHRVREKTTVTYNRGNRDWVQRQKCGKIVRLVEGNSWGCLFDLSLLPEMQAVEKFIKVEAA
jgi:hypothetical protein